MRPFYCLLLVLLPGLARAQTVTVSAGAVLAVGSDAVLDLAGATLDLGGTDETASISEAGGGRITGGTLTATRTLDSPAAVDVAGLGFVVTTSANLGAVTVTRGHTAQTVSGHAGVLRYYDVTPAQNNSDLSATVTFRYDDDELNGLAESTLALYRSQDGGTSWVGLAATVDAANDRLTATGIDRFSRWTAGGASASASVTGSAGWRFLSSPLTSATLDDLLAGTWTQDMPNADTPGAAPNVFTYDEAVAGAAGQGWTAVTSDQTTTTMTPGTGYAVYLFEDDDFSTPGVVDGGFPKALALTGPFNAAPFSSFSLACSNGCGTSDGWNLVGNPFPATLSWPDLVAANGLGDGLTRTVYLWSNEQGQYLTHNGTSGTGSPAFDGLLAPFQGFFVKARSSADLTMTLTNDVMTTGGALFKRAATPAQVPLVRLLLQGAHYAASAVVELSERGLPGRDAFDGYQLTPMRSGYAQLYTESLGQAEGEAPAALVLNALPIDVDGPVALPLHAVSTEDGAMTLLLQELRQLDGWAVHLRDDASDTCTDLRQLPYAFEHVPSAGKQAAAAPGGMHGPQTVAAVATEPARFTLVLRPPSSTSPDACGEALPVELVSFTATADGEAVSLAWATASETNNAGFEVEHRTGRSADRSADSTWRPLGFVAGSGTTVEAKAYGFRTAVLAPGTHRFRLRQVDYDGAARFSPEVEVVIDVPLRLALEANYPNPFNPQTTIRFTLPGAGRVRLAVYDVLGRQVRVLVEGPTAAGRHAIPFDGTTLPSGVYYYRLEHAGHVLSRRMALVK